MPVEVRLKWAISVSGGGEIWKVCVLFDVNPFYWVNCEIARRKRIITVIGLVGRPQFASVLD